MRYQAWASRSLGMFILLMALGADPALAEIDSKRLSSPTPLPEFTLKDHKGKTFNKKSLINRWTLFTLGYTNCPDICPFTLQNLASVYREMSTLVSPANLPHVVFLAVDPDRDAEYLAEYVDHFDSSFAGVTGPPPPQIKILVEGLNGFFRLNKKSKDDDGYVVQHSAQVSVVNPEGKIIATLNPPFDPASAAAFLAGLMREARQKATH